MKENSELPHILDDLFSENTEISHTDLSNIFSDHSQGTHESNFHLDDKITISPDILDEILFRFFLDIPMIEMHPVRISFILEEAHWFLIDFYPQYRRISFYNFSACLLHYVVASEKIFCSSNNHDDETNKSIDSFQNIINRESHSNRLLEHNQVSKIFISANQPLPLGGINFNLPSIIKSNLSFYLKMFLNYKHSVPVFACLILNETMEYVLLNKGYGKKAQLLFPRGKKGFNETGRETAIREVYEEIGLDISDKVMDVMFLPKREKYHILIVVNQKMSTPLQTQTRYEIKDIQWVKISDILNNHSKTYDDIDMFDTSFSCVSSNSYYNRSDLLNIRAVFYRIRKQLDYLRGNRVTLNRKRVLQYFDKFIDEQH